MSYTLRNGLGRPVTHTEMDDNFEYTHIVSVARSLNVLEDEIILSTDTGTVLDNVLYIYNPDDQTTYAVPSDVVAGESIDNVSGSTLTTDTAATYLMLPALPDLTGFVSATKLGITSSLSDTSDYLNRLTDLGYKKIIIDDNLTVESSWLLDDNMYIVFVGGSVNSSSISPCVAIRATSKSNITTVNLTSDGGATGTEESGTTRTVRFISCTDVQCLGKTTITNQFDWGLSFETCTRPYVENFYTLSTYDDSVAGGRDGVHFLDCQSPKIMRARGRSGDDLVSFTVEATDCSDVFAQDIKGSSVVANVCLLGQESTGSFNYTGVCTVKDVWCDTTGTRSVLTIEPSGTTGNGKLVLENIGVNNDVQTTNHAIYVEGWDGSITANNLVGDSSLQHGVHLTSCGDVAANNVLGNSDTDTFDGINYTSCGDVTATNHSANECAENGLSIVTCDDVIVGAYRLKDNAAINLRITDCEDVVIGEGDGRSTGTGITAIGLRQAGNNSTVISDGAYFYADDSYNTSAAQFALKAPIYALKATDSGTLTAQSQFGGTIVKNSTGNYSVTFDDEVVTTNFMVIGSANGGHIEPGGQATTGFVFEVKDYTGANIDSTNIALNVLITAL